MFSYRSQTNIEYIHLVCILFVRLCHTNLTIYSISVKVYNGLCLCIMSLVYSKNVLRSSDLSNSCAVALLSIWHTVIIVAMYVYNYFKWLKFFVFFKQNLRKMRYWMAHLGILKSCKLCFYDI